MTGLNAGEAIAFINVSDRERGKAFYGGVLGLPLRKSDGFGDVFDVGRAQLRMTALPDHKASGHPLLGWEVDGLEAAMRDLRGRGIEFVIHEGFGQDAEGIWTAPDGGSQLAWFADPDGNVLTLTGA